MEDTGSQESRGRERGTGRDNRAEVERQRQNLRERGHR